GGNGVNRFVLGTLGALAVAITSIGSLAWACTGLATVVGTVPPLGVSGTRVTVEGLFPAPGQKPIDLRWDALQGDVLTTVTPDARGHFSASFTVPPASNGIHTVVLSAEGGAIARTTFDVTGPTGQTFITTAPPPVGGSPQASQNRTGAGASLAAGLSILAAGTVLAAAGVGAVVVQRRRSVVS
ncbi:MAG TPA: hypothetical protein VJ777_22190, partial [Mycobacterium sp.]|nr:hypothetical protein [Mycobacterium sp.]